MIPILLTLNFGLVLLHLVIHLRFKINNNNSNNNNNSQITTLFKTFCSIIHCSISWFIAYSSNHSISPVLCTVCDSFMFLFSINNKANNINKVSELIKTKQLISSSQKHSLRDSRYYSFPKTYEDLYKITLKTFSMAISHYYRASCWNEWIFIYN